MWICVGPRDPSRPIALHSHNTACALPAWVSLWTILNRPTQSRTDAASSAMDDATRTIEIERTITTQFENTELSGELHEVHRGLKGCVRDERCDTVPLASMLDSCTECKLQVEASLRTFDSLGIAGSELGRPALAGLSSLTTWVEETIAKGQLLRRCNGTDGGHRALGADASCDIDLSRHR